MAEAALALFIAAGLSLVLTPVFRRLAIASGFVDRPAARKSHVRPTAYLGGLALAAGTAGGAIVVRGVVGHAAVIALAAGVLVVVGLLDDARGLSASFRLAAQGLAALAVILAGVRADVTGEPLVDGLLSVVWVVGITNALNLLDNMDGLAAGTAAVAAAAVAAIALLGGQEVVGTVAAALVGSCIGFLLYNRRPASIFMGDAGSLLLGFLLAVLTLEADPAELTPPGSFLVPLLVLAVPVLDTTTVTLARLRRGRSVNEGGKDHLSHRLVARGLQPGPAVLVLVAFSAVLGLLATLAAEELLPTPLVVGATALVVAALGRLALPMEVYPGMTTALRPAYVTVVVVLGGAALVLGLLGTAADGVDHHASVLRAGPSSSTAGAGLALAIAGVALVAAPLLRRRARDGVHSDGLQVFDRPVEQAVAGVEHERRS